MGQHLRQAGGSFGAKILCCCVLWLCHAGCPDVERLSGFGSAGVGWGGLLGTTVDGDDGIGNCG